jgi:hypothetical protein
MPLHSVRFDDETERALEEVCAATGASVSVALKRGVLALRARLATRPYDVYASLDLGPGGYAAVPARRAKAGVAAVIRRRGKRGP